MDNEELKKTIEELPDAILKEENRLIALVTKTDALQKQTKEQSDHAWVIVNAETDEDGKKKFSNDKLRETAQNACLAANTEYMLLQDQVTETVRLQGESKALLSYYRNKMRSLSMLIDMMKIELRLV